MGLFDGPRCAGLVGLLSDIHCDKEQVFSMLLCEGMSYKSGLFTVP